MSLIFVTVAVAVLVAVLAGGRFRAFPSIPLRWWALAVLGVALQYARPAGDLAFASLLASFLLLLAFAFANLRTPGFVLILAGVLLNTVVIAANRGMPVTREALARSGQLSTLDELRTSGGAKHRPAGDGSVLLPLADAIGIPKPIGEAVSVGDLSLQLGVGWFIVAASRPRRPVEILT